VGTDDGKVSIWDTVQGKVIASVTYDSGEERLAMVCSPNGNSLIVGTEKRVYLLKVSVGGKYLGVQRCRSSSFANHRGTVSLVQVGEHFPIAANIHGAVSFAEAANKMLVSVRFNQNDVRLLPIRRINEAHHASTQLAGPHGRPPSVALIFFVRM
jgi:WD40 repeat protein